jgi:hypothetical protein
MIPEKCTAFIQFTTREAAERAAERSFEQLVLKVCYLNSFSLMLRF